MLDAIASLGKLQYSDNPTKLMQSLVRFTRISKETTYYMTLDFSTKSRKLSLQIAECNNKPSAPRYTPQQLNYIGIVASAGLQYHATNHDLRHLCSQVLPALLDKLPVDSKLHGSIQQVLSSYFVLDQEDPKNRYRYLLDVEAANLGSAGITDKIIQSTAIKERPEAIAKELRDWVKKEKQVAPEQIKLFAVSINGQLIAQHPDYIRAVLDDQVSMFAKAQEGICCVTGQIAPVSADLTKFKFKYYITDKLNFSSGISGKYEHNFQLSQAGVWQLLLGERYIMNRLRLRVGSFNVYMIPEFLEASAYDEAQIRETINEVYDDVRQLSSLKEVRRIEEGLNKELRIVAAENGIRTQMLINLLFYEENKNEMKVYRHVKDISPSRITFMNNKSDETQSYFRKIAPHFHANKPSLESIYYMIPLQVDGKGKVKNPQILMQRYDSILSGRKLNRRELIESFVDLLARVYFQTTGGLQIAKRGGAGEASSEMAWIRLVWDQVQYIHWLEEIGNLQKLENGGDVGMVIELLEGLEKEQEHIQASGFGEAKAAMFLLGSTIKLVADAQHAKLKSKPILQKLNFRGMSNSSLERLISEVFEKANYYRKDTYFPRLQFDKYYSEMKRLLDLSEQADSGGKSRLSQSEAIFYVLSGYSFQVGVGFKAKRIGSVQAGEGPADDYESSDADHAIGEEGEDDNE
jgi:CRISPR-associated protein Csh1